MARKPEVSMPADTLERIAAAAEADSGAPRPLLGRYLAASLESAGQGRRLAGTDLQDFRRLGQRAAEQGVPLARLLDLYLTATWRLSEAVTTTGPPADVGSWATALLRASDDAAEALSDGYQEAQRRAIRREESIRREFVDDLLGGTADPDTLRELARQVGFNVAGSHRAVVARTDRPLRDAGIVQAHVETSLLQGRAAGGLVATKDGLLVCVLPADAGRPADVGDVVLRQVRTAEAGDWRLGVGAVHAGAAGVARSFREARQALDVAVRLGLPEPVADHAALGPFRVLMQDTVLLAETVEAVLGPLDRARGGGQPLVETLEAYFDEALSATAAARRLHLSVRAVTYRLDRIASLTGRSLRDPNDRFALELAVRSRRLLAHPSSDGAPDPEISRRG